MPAQAVATAALGVSMDVCPQCGLLNEVLRLRLEVGDTTKVEEGCHVCLGLNDSDLVLDAPIRIKDVIDLQARARCQETKRISTNRECRAAEDVGGRRVSGSGSGISKGDARNSSWMVEDKFTTGRTFTLERTILSKAISQASKTGRRPVIRVGLSDGTELAICLWHDMKEVICEDDQSSDDR